MLGSTLHRLCFTAALLPLSACSWSRFGDLEDDTPVVLLTKPDQMSGFGVSLATASVGVQTQLLVGGAPTVSRAAVFALGNGDEPGVDANSSNYCENKADAQCYLGTSMAGIGSANMPGSGEVLNFCFAVGLGNTPKSGSGVILECASGTSYALHAPASIQSAFVEPAIAEKRPTALALASDRTEQSALVVGASSKQLAWGYGSPNQEALALAPPGAPDKSFGQNVAVLRFGGEPVFVVAAPGEGHVWLFRGPRPTELLTGFAPFACLGSSQSFGRALAAGRVDSDDKDELVVADGTTVSVFNGAALAALPRSTECGLPAAALQVSLKCATTSDVDGCAGSEFGAALAVGDLDGDGDGEVVVGAPRMKARDASSAGAVLVYDAEGDHADALSEALFISSAEDDDQLGAAVATPWIGDRHILAAGAPGGGKTALFYCSKLLPDSKRGKRCR